jgi:hypothetical protein
MTIINNNAISSIPAKFTMNFTINTMQLISEGKLRVDGNDLRVVWWNSSSSSCLELNRLNTTNFNTASTTIKFRTQTSILASSSDDNYSIYYGYGGGTNPPANGDNVYFFEDLFNRADSSTVGVGWMEYDGIVGSGTSNARILNNKLNLLSANAVYDTQAYYMLVGLSNRSIWEFEWNFSRTGAETTYSMWMQLGKYSLMSNASNTVGASVYLDWTGTGAARGPAASAHEMLRVWNGGSVTEIGVLTGSHLIKLDMDLTAGSFTVYVDGNNKGTYAVYQKLSSYDCIRFVFEQATPANFGSYDVDSTRTYLTINPNPSVNINQEQYLFGNYVSGTVPASVQTVDSNYFIVESASSGTSTTAYNSSSYALVGSTSFVSGTIGDLVSNNNVYMTFRSYSSATSGQPLYGHQETTTIGGSSYYFQRLSSADASGTTLSASAASTGRKLMGKFVYQLTGVSSIPASTWTMYYRAYRDTGSVTAHGDVDILIRMSNGTVRATVATNVANSPSDSVTTSWSTISGTYSWTAYTVVSQTDYLEIDYYIEVTSSGNGKFVYLRIDDSTLATADQTRGATIVLPSQFTSEVEFTGSSNTQSWYQLVWTVDSAWTAASVTVTIQVYNYTLGGYSASGNGYNSYTSSSTANTDETKTQTITINPTSFRDASGNWKIKVKGVKTTTTQFDFKADWVEFKPSYYSEYTVSTEFLFSSMTTNTPSQLNFTVVSEYNIASVSVTIQVWNYSSSAYVTSDQGYQTYSSSGVNETKLLSINTNPQFYSSSGNAKIKMTGVLATTTQYQQKVNQVKLIYSYSSSSSYNYVLKIVNQVTDTWKIRLKAYSQSNIGRLTNCTIYFRSSTDGTSRQIYIINGAYVNQTGSWYDLPASPAERYIVVALQATNSQVSYVYVYLEILVPNKTTYVQYIITFEIT